MARDKESTMQWKLDIADLKKGMQDARREISLANAEFKNATAGMARWSDSADGVEAKTRQLTKVLDSQQAILKDLKGQYEIVAREMGETSPEAQRLKIQIENQEAACKKTQAQLSAYNDQLAELKDEEAKAQTPMAKLNSTIDEQESAVADLKRQYASAIVGDNPQEAARLAGEIDKLSGELSDNKKRMQDAERAADELDRSIEDAGDAASEAAGGGFTVLKGALADLISSGIQEAIGFISGLASEAIASADALQKFEGTMGFAGFDDTKIQEARDAVKQYADDTVYDLDTIANTTAQLAANGIKDYTGLTQAAGNLNAVAGGNADTFNSVAMMMTQTAGAGKLTTENWNQLADAIPGASGKLQEALKKAGAYTGDFREAMSKGEITADEFNAAIMELGNDPIAVEAATSVSTFEGAMGNLEATVVSGLMEIYNQIGSENITGFITKISDGIQKVIPYIQKAVQFVLDNKEPIGAALAGIAAGIAAISAIQGIMTMVGAFKNFFAIVKSGQGIVAAFNVVMGLNPFVLIAGAVLGLVTALVVLFNTNEDFRNKVIEIWGNIKDFMGKAIDAIVKFFTVTVPNGIKAMLEWFKQLPGKIGDFMTQAWTKVKNWASDMVSKARDTGAKFISSTIEFFQQLPGKVWDWLKNVVTKVAEWGTNLADKGKEAAKKLYDKVVEKVKELPDKMLSIGSDLVKGLWNGISNMTDWVIGKIQGFGDSVLGGIKSFFGIESPSKVMRDQVGKMLAEGIAEGFSAEMPDTLRDMQKSMSGTVDALKGSVSVAADGVTTNRGGFGVAGDGSAIADKSQTVVFNQYNSSPKALDRLTIYRDTNSLLFSAKVGLKNV